MKELEQIKESLNIFQQRAVKYAVASATVTAINTDDTIAVIFDSGLEVDDVRLKSVIKSGDKIILVPAVGSAVVVARIDESTEFVVIAVDEITELRSEISGSEFKHNAQGFLFKKGGETLSDILSDLVDAIINEIHFTNVGPTAGLTPDAEARYMLIKQRIGQLLSTN